MRRRRFSWLRSFLLFVLDFRFLLSRRFFRADFFFAVFGFGVGVIFFFEFVVLCIDEGRLSIGWSCGVASFSALEISLVSEWTRRVSRFPRIGRAVFLHRPAREGDPRPMRQMRAQLPAKCGSAPLRRSVTERAMRSTLTALICKKSYKTQRAAPFRRCYRQVLRIRR